LELRKFQADGFLVTRVYVRFGVYCIFDLCREKKIHPCALAPLSLWSCLWSNSQFL